MATEITSRRSGRRRDRGRVPYRLTIAQVLAMREQGILSEDEDIKLWGGILYRMVKHEPHHYTVGVTAEALRPLIPTDDHVREEKSSRQEPHFLPEPDLAVAWGSWRSYVNTIPTLDRLALVVEVCASTRRADFVTKPSVFAGTGIPVYWVVDLRRRQIVVFREPRSQGRHFQYASQIRFGSGETLDVVIDGEVRGRLAVDDLLPPLAPKD